MVESARERFRGRSKADERTIVGLFRFRVIFTVFIRLLLDNAATLRFRQAHSHVTNHALIFR